MYRAARFRGKVYYTGDMRDMHCNALDKILDTFENEDIEGILLRDEEEIEFGFTSNGSDFHEKNDYDEPSYYKNFFKENLVDTRQ